MKRRTLLLAVPLGMTGWKLRAMEFTFDGVTWFRQYNFLTFVLRLGPYGKFELEK